MLGRERNAKRGGRPDRARMVVRAKKISEPKSDQSITSDKTEGYVTYPT
jgi:hypothetical protein